MRHIFNSLLFELVVVNCVCTAEEGFRAETYCIYMYIYIYILSSFCLLCLCSERRLLNIFKRVTLSFTISLTRTKTFVYCIMLTVRIKLLS